MNEIKTFEEFDTKVKALEREKIRLEEQVKNAKENLDNNVKLLCERTQTDSVKEAIEYMKNLKEKINNQKEVLDKEIKYFNEQIAGV